MMKRVSIILNISIINNMPKLSGKDPNNQNTLKKPNMLIPHTSMFLWYQFILRMSRLFDEYDMRILYKIQIIPY